VEDGNANEVVASLYEAAVDNARWTTALTKLAKMVDAGSATCFLHEDSTNATIEARGIGTPAPKWLNAYTDHYQPLDLARRALERLTPGTMHRYIEPTAIDRSEYHQDFYLPSGLRYSCGGAQLVDGKRAILAVHRPVGHRPYDDHAVRRLQVVLDHLPGVCRVQSLSRSAKTKGSLCTSVLAALPRAVFVLDPCLRVQYLNPAAEDFLRTERTMHMGGGRIQTGDAALTCSLLKRVVGVCQRPPRVDAAPLYRADSEGRAVLEIQVAPLPEDIQGDWRAEPLALVTARPVFRLAGWQGAGARPYGLTDAEFRLVVALVEGLTPEEYGIRESIAVSTVRIHIRNALRKTATRRAAEIIALFAPLEVLKSRS